MLPHLERAGVWGKAGMRREEAEVRSSPEVTGEMKPVR